MQSTPGPDPAAPASDDPDPRRPAAPPRTLGDPGRPVFMDASGRRHRRTRLLGLSLTVPAAGYVALVLSSALGGPTLDIPFVPLPEPGSHAVRPHVPAASASAAASPATTAPAADGGTEVPGGTPGLLHPVAATQAPGTSSGGGAAPAASATSSAAPQGSAPGTTAPGTAAPTTAAPTATASGGDSASTSPSATPTASPTPTHKRGRDRASTAPGASHRPVR